MPLMSTTIPPQQRIEADVKAALKAGEKEKLSTLRIRGNQTITTAGIRLPDSLTDTTAQSGIDCPEGYPKEKRPRRAGAFGKRAGRILYRVCTQPDTAFDHSH